MRNKYKDSMDKIIVDDEMKKRILSNLDKMEEPRSLNKSMTFIRRAGMYAACFAFVLGGIGIKSFISQSKINEDKYVVVEDDSIDIENETNSIDMQNEDHNENSYISEVQKENEQEDNKSFIDNTYKSYSRKDKSSKEDKVIAYNDTIDKTNRSNDNIKEEKVTVNEEESSDIGETSNTSLNENPIINQEITEPNSNSSIDNMNNGRSLPLEINNLNFEFKISKVLEDNYDKRINFVSDDIIDIAYTKENNTIEYKAYKGELDLNSIDDYKEIEINNTDFKFNINEEDIVKSIIWNDDNVSYNMKAYEGISKEEAEDIVKSLDTFN